MAVCGRCWICGAKFVCSELESCGDCTEHKPLRVYAGDGSGLGLTRICGRCERDIDSGAVGSLVGALRAARD